MSQLINLELGGGGQPIKARDSSRTDYVNMDAYEMPGVDIVHDATKFPWPYADNSVSNIFSSEFMEHISYHQFPKLMEESFRVLRPGGTFSFECPDFKGIMDQFFTNRNPQEVWYMMRGIWGDQARDYDVHLHGLYEALMRAAFETQGFINIMRYPAPTWRVDYKELKQQFSEDFLQSVKLCMSATKPV